MGEEKKAPLDGDDAKAAAKAAYREISAVLTEPASSCPDRLELEILKHEEHLLRDGNAVGIPKTALVQAFCVGRILLQKYRAGLEADDSVARSATAVILMLHPEHLTAANTRKRLFAKVPADKREEALRDELRLIDSFLTSYLHRHTKSPTLWNHRRWLRETTDTRDLAGDMEVVFAAAERHPRNYYAWDHARWMVARTGTSDSDSDSSQIDAVAEHVRDWCFRHHDDTAGWSFLQFLLVRFRPDTTFYKETVQQVAQLAASLRWTGETVWVFLRTAAAYSDRQTQSQTQSAILEDAAVAVQSKLEAASTEYQTVQRARDWCSTYR